jgi:hypothetical protein
MLKSNFLYSLLLLGSFAYGQGGPPMITDDPGTPGDGHWEINVAGLTDRTAGVNTIQSPLIDLNYGVGARIQLKYEVPWIIEDQGGDSRTGLGNSLLGVKWRFYDAGPAGWQISTYPQVEFNYPSSSSPRRGLADPGTRYLIPFEFERSYADFDINVEVGRWIRPAGAQDSWVAGFVIGHELVKGIEVIAELHDENDVHSPDHELIANFGARWDLSDRYTILLSAGRDLTNTLGARNTLLTYFGLQMRL